MPRLFSAIALSNEVTAELAALRRPLPGARWIEPGDMHITLRFFGDVTPAVARELTSNLANITFDPFTIRFENLATFGGDAPRLLFARIADSEPLRALARANETAARRATLKPESRKFTPHVTLARFSHPRIEPIARFLSHHGAFRTAPLLVDQFALFSARPNVGGGPYVVEHRFHSTLGIFDDDGIDDYDDHDDQDDARTS